MSYRIYALIGNDILKRTIPISRVIGVNSPNPLTMLLPQFRSRVCEAFDSLVHRDYAGNPQRKEH